MIVSLRVCRTRHVQSTENNQFTISLQYLNENVKDEVDFLPADKCQRFLQCYTIILGVCGQACLAIFKFAISLQHVKKEVSDAVDFLHADKHESLPQIQTKIFWWGWSSIPKVTKIASLQCFYNISKKMLEMKLIFWMQINIKVFYKLISTLWASKFPTRW